MMNESINTIDEEKVLGEVMAASKALLESFKFSIRYHSRVSEEQEKRTETVLKKYRNENWKRALSKAKGNKKLAYKFYTQNLNKFF
ncbi:hypothetical protein J4470_00850 [Candidatus Woesearchaeota archaeon]|nr:hypothetical protein [Candidatus Woesearchaeota archaeon]